MRLGARLQDVRASDVADAFRDACDAHAEEPRLRALALKRHLCGMSEKGSAFSFVLLDARTARVFAATTFALSSPVAAGHAADGTLLVTCTRSGAKAATAWPPRWAPGEQRRVASRIASDASDASRTRANLLGASPPSATCQTWVSSELLSKPLEAPLEASLGAPATPEREPLSGRPSSPASTERSRSRSPGASSTHSTGTEASEAAYQAAVTTRLQHLPAGRFVYGRKHLQPFEFSAFWGSAESTRAGARATSAPEGAREGARDGDAFSGRGARDRDPDALEPRATANGAESSGAASDGNASGASRARSRARGRARREEPAAVLGHGVAGGRGVELAQETAPRGARARRRGASPGRLGTRRRNRPRVGKGALRGGARRVPGDGDGGGSAARVVPRGARTKPLDGRLGKPDAWRADSRVRLLGADVTERCTITNLELT